MIDRARFWRFVQLLDDSDDACWIWTGAMRDDGRGRFSVGRREITAHRAAWEIRTGEPAPAGYRLEQECNHPQCVRHWKLGGPVRKLGDEAVAAIRRSGCSIREIARRWRASRTHVWAIKHCERRA